METLEEFFKIEFYLLQIHAKHYQNLLVKIFIIWKITVWIF